VSVALPARSRRPRRTVALGGLLAVLAGVLGCRESRAADVQGTGTLEVVEVDVAPLAPGRVVRVLVQEGQSVRVGETVAILAQPTLPADIEGRRARVSAAEAQLRDLERGARTAEIEAAEAELRTAEAEAVRTVRDLTRLQALLDAGAISRQQLDAARAAAQVATGRRDSAREALRLMRQGARPEQISAARAEVASARAALQSAERTAGDLTLTAPVNGIVVSRNAEPGEVIGGGQSVVTIADPARPFVRIYVNQRVLPLIRRGGAATATLDAFPDRRFPGHITAINPRAEFTPRVALTEDEREDLLFGVKIDLTDASGMLKAGLPVTVRIPAAMQVARP
jgi:HlyD family secretion protein